MQMCCCVKQMQLSLSGRNVLSETYHREHKWWEVCGVSGKGFFMGVL